VPLFGLAIMPLAMLGLIGLAAGWSQAPLLHWAADLIAVLLGFLDWLDWGAWQGPALVAQWLPVAVIAAAALLWPRPLPGRACALGLLLAVPFLGSRGPPAGDFRIMVLDVGQGLAVVVQTHTHALVYDAGPAYGAGDAGHSVVLPALRATGVRRLHALVVSHSDMDHAGGAVSVHSAFPRAAVLAPEPVRGVPVVHDCHAGQAWRWDGVVFRILHPPDGPRRGPQNDQSCVLLISTPRGGSVLLPGDISRRAEPRVIDRLPAGPLDLVIAPHHGSASSSTAAFVAATRPRYVVFAAGYRNRWDFPRPSVATRWRRSGACLLNTASDGTLRFQTGPSGLRLRSRYRADAARWWSAAAATPACGDAHPAL
jgi:competence protein ComEC